MQQKQGQNQEACRHAPTWMGSRGPQKYGRVSHGRNKKWKGRRRDSRNVFLHFPTD